MKNNKKSDKYIPLFLKIATTFLFIAFLFPFIVNYFFSDWNKSGTFGDTFGALNALFSGLALAGVIVTILIQRTELKNQQIELALQRTEMRETRKEFLLNRTTSLVYNQLERFEKALSKLIIKTPNGVTVKGNDAILHLYDNENIVSKPNDKSEEEYKAEIRAALIELLKLYLLNKSEIEKFSHSISTSIDVLKRLIYKTDLEIEELNDLKNLFFINIGFITMGVIERIVEVNDNRFKYLEAKDYIENNLNSNLIISDVFLGPIVNFYKLKLTKENFKENKSNWIDSLGNLEK